MSKLKIFPQSFTSDSYLKGGGAGIWVTHLTCRVEIEKKSWVRREGFHFKYEKSQAPAVAGFFKQQSEKRGGRADTKTHLNLRFFHAFSLSLSLPPTSAASF